VKVARRKGAEVHREQPDPSGRAQGRAVDQRLTTAEALHQTDGPPAARSRGADPHRTTDVVFAVDSIPAILAVSREPFIVFSSNAFAILGLRSLYFLLAGMAGRFRYLNVGLGAILFFVGIKMIIVEWYHFPTWVSLLVIASMLTITIWLSLRAEKRDLAIDAKSSGHSE
jgi:hypothetical protein